MAKIYGISGTPWHIERAHNEDPSDSRRHRSRCAYYDKESKHCRKQFGMCVGASHCTVYLEKNADTVVIDEPEKIKTSNVSSFKYERSPKPGNSAMKDISVGAFVFVDAYRYIVLKKNIVQGNVVSYTCQRVIIVPGIENPKGNRRWIYKDYFIGSNEKFTFKRDEITRAENSIPAKCFEDFIRRRNKPVKPIRNSTPVTQTIVPKTPVTGNGGINKDPIYVSLNQYRIVAYEGKLKWITDHSVSPMIFKSRSGKQILISVDEAAYVLYMTKSNYFKYGDEIRSAENFDLYPT